MNVGENSNKEQKHSDKEKSDNQLLKIEMGDNPLIHGRVREYVPGENVDVYLDHVADFFALNAGTITAAQHAVYFLNAIGATPFSKLTMAFRPAKASTKTFVELSTKFKAIFEQTRNVQVERARFSNNKRLAGASIMDFVEQLQTIAEHCDFGATLEERVKTQFVAGINDQRMLSKLLTLATTATLQDTVNKAREAELIAEQSVAMCEATMSESVNFVNHRSGSVSNNQQFNQRFSRGLTAGKSNDLSKVKCHRCHQLGHFARTCRRNQPRTGHGQQSIVQPGIFRAGRTQTSLNAIYDALEDLQLHDSDDRHCNGYDGNETSEMEGTDEELNTLMGEPNELNKPVLVEVALSGKVLLMEGDTGASVSVCSLEDYRKHFPFKRLRPCEKRLKVISGDQVLVKGQIIVEKLQKNKIIKLPLIVVDTPKSFVPLLGRNWLNILAPNWRKTFTINQIRETSREDKRFVEEQVRDMKTKYASVFDGDLTKPMKVEPVEIHMKSDAVPFVHKPYSVPFAMREKVENHLNELLKRDIIERVDYAKWASPLVVVAKPNKKDIRVCMDGSRTVNPFIETHHYPLPLIDELLVNKAGAKRFTVLDLKGAYQQLIVSERTKQLLVVNTHLGLFAFKRLPFGVKPAASIFQQVMDQVLAGLSNVETFIDDILIWAEDDRSLADKVDRVLQRLSEFNVKVNPDKCQWFADRIIYLGHVLSEGGVKANPDKILAISRAPVPRDVTQLKAFIGMVSFYQKFAKNMNVTLSPLFKLLHEGAEWDWDENCQNSFDDCKTELCSNNVLTHYDPNKSITVTCDACDDGIGAVLSHSICGREHPVLFASRTLSTAERNYPILHREALAIVFAMEKFYKYVYGKHVSIVTDHKPLEGVLGKRGAKSAVVASRLQRYVIRLSIFDYTIRYVPGKDIANADCLSRLPLNDAPNKADQKEAVLSSINSISEEHLINLNLSMIRSESANDPILSAVNNFMSNGWPSRVADKTVKLYWAMKDALNIDNGVVTMNDRVVIPRALRDKALHILHKNHRGEEKMKLVAREIMFWEHINTDIEKFYKGCHVCQSLGKDKSKKSYGKWPAAAKPMERVHLDFFHFNSKSYLILVDAFSRWVEIKGMTRTTASDLQSVLDIIFATLGHPSTIVSDNGPPFSSAEFAQYCDFHDIEQIFSPPYHPQSNGLAERAVQTTKAALRKLTFGRILSNPQISMKINSFLFTHRNTPTTDGIVPARLILNYRPKTELSKLIIEKKKTFTHQAAKVNTITDNNPKYSFKPNDRVLYINKERGWCQSLPATVISKLSDRVYWVMLDGKSAKKAQFNQLKPYKPPFLITNSSISSAMSPPTNISRPQASTLNSPILISSDSDPEFYDALPEPIPSCRKLSRNARNKLAPRTRSSLKATRQSERIRNRHHK